MEGGAAAVLMRSELLQLWVGTKASAMTLQAGHQCVEKTACRMMYIAQPPNWAAQSLDAPNNTFVLCPVCAQYVPSMCPVFCPVCAQYVPREARTAAWKTLAALVNHSWGGKYEMEGVRCD
jgi:hypothetical protein